LVGLPGEDRTGEESLEVSGGRFTVGTREELQKFREASRQILIGNNFRSVRDHDVTGFLEASSEA
jgi:hypothetical protein